jgi:hypothetical protein
MWDSWPRMEMEMGIEVWKGGGIVGRCVGD